MSLMLSLSYIFILLCTKYKVQTTLFSPRGKLHDFSFSGRIMTAYGLGDSAHRVLSGREPEDVKDLGR
jgi:hypothetical protein